MTSCSTKQAEYTNAIPADASQVVAINLKSLGDKAGLKEKENREALQKLTDVLKNELNAATYQEVEAVLNDPSKSGIDVEAPIYLFEAPSFPHPAVVARVTDEDNLRQLLETAEKEQVVTRVEEADGCSFARMEGRGLIAFTPTTLVAVNAGRQNLEKVKGEVSALLRQPAGKSIVGSAAFQKMQKQDGDIALLISPSDIARINPSLRGVQQGFGLNELQIIGSLAFGKGKIEAEFEYHTDNKELKARMEKQMECTSAIGNSFLKYLPKSTLALLSVGLDGEAIYDLLQENEKFRNEFTVTKAAEAEQLFSAFDGDLTVGLVNVAVKGDPSFVAYADVKSDAPLKVLYDKRAELGLGRGEEIVKLSESDYVFKSRKSHVFFGIRGKQMYATNDELIYKNICKAADPSVKETAYASTLKGNRLAVVVSAEAILDLPVVKMMAGFGGEQFGAYYAALGNVSYLEALVEKDKATVTLQLKNKEVNALKQMVDYLRQFISLS